MKVHVRRRLIARLIEGSGTLLVVAGLAAFAWCGTSLLRARIYQEEKVASLDQKALFRPVKMVNRSPKEGSLLGSVSIPRVGVSSVIIEGTDNYDLALSVGHIPGTAVPGQKGNVALAGHRDTFFRGLKNIRDKDDILISTPGGTQVYQVESTRIVSPEDVDVLNDVGRPLLTLVTCYPFSYIGAAPKRFIVQARLVGPTFTR
jgi:LPXTG-site transpeptidase (sortase) family protein